MSWVLELHLIPLFSFYLAIMFLLSTILRLRQYKTVVGLVARLPSRWPRLLKLVRGYHHLFLTWGTFIPLILTTVVLGIHTIARWWIWPSANLHVREWLEVYPMIPVVMICGLAMVAFDTYNCWVVGSIDRQVLEKSFDQAEYWLRSWTAPVVNFFTLGYINPRQMVDKEVRTALLGVSSQINTALWWVVLQTSLRIVYGLSLWITWAVHP